MLQVFAIGLGGFFGAIMRYLISGWTYRLLGERLPYGTLVVNIIGSFILGLFLVLANERFVVSDAMRGFIAIGMMGALTTFSTFSYETISLLQSSLFLKAGLNIFLNVVCTLCAVWAGTVVARAV